MTHSIKFYSADVAYKMIARDGQAKVYGSMPFDLFPVKRERRHKMGRVELYIKSYRTLKGGTAVMLDKAYILDESGECERIGQKYRKYLPYEPF